MPGPATFARDADAASAARDRLDRAVASAAAVDHAQRNLLADLLALWPTSAWVAAGATSAKRWLLAYTHCSEAEAHRLERVAGLCHRHPTLADAVLSGELALARADTLGRTVTDEREPWLADSLDAFLHLNARGCPAEDWSTAIRHWAGLVDQERAVRQIPRHSLTMSQRLFGGGEIHADLSPSAFLNVANAINAWTDDPDPKDAVHQRSLAERRADALDDLSRASTDPDDTRWGVTTDHSDDAVSEWEDRDAQDTSDGWAPTDTLDEALVDEHEPNLTDPLERLQVVRRRLRRAEACRRRRARRRTRARSDVTGHRRPRPALRVSPLQPTTSALRHPPRRTPQQGRPHRDLQRCAALPLPPPPPPRLRLEAHRRAWTMDRHRPPRQPLDRAAPGSRPTRHRDGQLTRPAAGRVTGAPGWRGWLRRSSMQLA